MIVIDIKSLINRLLKVCYVPATSAGIPRVSFFFTFLFLLLQPLMKQTRLLVHAIKQSIFLDVYDDCSYFTPISMIKAVFTLSKSC